MAVIMNRPNKYLPEPKPQQQAWEDVSHIQSKLSLNRGSRKRRDKEIDFQNSKLLQSL